LPKIDNALLGCENAVEFYRTSAVECTLDLMITSLTPAQRLEQMGFRKCADWKIEKGTLKCRFIEHANAQNVLYAFVSDGVVLYIGKTVRTLKHRMYNYQRPGPTQSTSIRGNSLLRERISSGKQVEVHALPDNGLLYYGGFHVNLAAGLEDSLLAALKPAWNKAGI
jgi:hypothetical protein